MKRRWFGVRGGAGAWLLAREAKKADRPLLVVVPEPADAEKWIDSVRFFLDESPDAPPLERRVHAFPAWDVEPLGGVSPTAEVAAERLATLHHWSQLPAPIVVASAESLLQRTPRPRDVVERSVYLVEGEEIDPGNLVDRLVDAGYHRVAQVEDRGELSVRGGVVDVYPAGVPLPVRLEFFGDLVESIREFDPATQRSSEALAEVLLPPWREIPLARWRDAASRRAVEARAQDLGVPRSERLALLSRMEAGLPAPGAEFLVPFCGQELELLPASAPSGTVVWIDRPAAVEAAEDAFWERIAGHVKAADEAGLTIPEPGSLYAEPEEIRGLRERLDVVELESIDSIGAEVDGVVNVRSYVTTQMASPTGAEPGKETSIRPFVRALAAMRLEGDAVRLVAHDEAQSRQLHGLLANHDVEAAILSRLPDDEETAPRLSIHVGLLHAGFRMPSERLTVITGEEIFGKRRRRKPRRVDVDRFLDSLGELKPGDPIVHVDHGIGRYQGLQHLQVAETEGDYLHLEYSGGDRLYVPVDRINVVQRYIGVDGSEPELAKLGGTAWERTKSRARESILVMARELVEIHAARELAEGHVYEVGGDAYREFEARFPFEETEGQEKAIEDVLADLTRERPMDRLVCGDVGFGKTEVALRAAFAVVLEGRQVLVLVPTTILAQQHYETFRDRFEGFPMRVELLSRFRKPAETKAVLDELREGKVDIVVGTHRLLQKDVAPRDLGLLVIDEEHRFGVKHKERIKQLKKTVDVLTLTATPIPRTLHMALSGIRDLSIIDSPPADRHAVRTYVTRRRPQVIRDAIEHELARHGQVFFVHNRIESIEKVAEELRELVPHARYAIAHGQMRPAELEDAMLMFVEGEIDVLVTTAIVESGLDIPNANTIVIDRADQLGLAQLYQLRGRVGRSHQRAYAYLLIPSEALLSDDATKRLEVLASLDDLGGGFRLAMHDLEIRGAGNLLGKEQSGQVAAVGFDLFTQMLEEAVNELRGEDVPAEIEPEIQLGVSAFLPENWVPDVHQRLGLYKRLGRVRLREELDDLRDEMVDRYGPPPARVETLFELTDLRRTLKQALVTRLRRQGSQIVLEFHPSARLDPEKLVGLVKSRRWAGSRALPDGMVHLPMPRIDVPGIHEDLRAALSLLGVEIS